MANPTSRGQQRDKPFRDALRMELAKLGEDDPKALRGLARKLLATAAADDGLAAIKEVADRLDGKPAQAMEMSGSLALSHEDALNELDEPGTDDQA
jgi:serine/threonine protein kinase HipA of HipAB toxin-antitoxin module